jgi:dTDP-4-dehydrorhamnose 3,5-epimerase
MIFEGVKLAGACVIELEPRSDERGFFARSFCEREFAEHGLPSRFPQCNLSRNVRAGTMRGMHYQATPHREAKLVRCAAGAIYDVIVDLRLTSPTRFEWIGVELSAENARALFVPEGFAHGFITLANGTDVTYHMSEFFRPEGARGFRWNDPRFGIAWPTKPIVIAERDAHYPDFDDSTFDR